jgi:thioredoxin-like negative regulator of GroEL
VDEYIDAYPYEGHGYAVGAEASAAADESSGTADLLGKLAVLGLAVAGVATAYAIMKKMSKSEKKTRRQASRSAMKMLSKAAEKQSERAVNAASERLGEFLTAPRLQGKPMRHVHTEILNHT